MKNSHFCFYLIALSILIQTPLALGATKKSQAASIVFQPMDPPTSVVKELEPSKKESPQTTATASPQQFTPTLSHQATLSKIAERDSLYWGLGALTGIINYPGVDNLESVLPLGGLGLRSHLGWGVHIGGEFLYSYYEIDVDRLVLENVETVDDYIFTLNAGYDLLKPFSQVKRPYSLILGAVASHHRRQYNLDENASRTIDVGGYLEANYFLTHQWLLAFQWRYLTNTYLDRDEPLVSQDARLQRVSARGNITKLEELDFQMFLLSLHYIF